MPCGKRDGHDQHKGCNAEDGLHDGRERERANKPGHPTVRLDEAIEEPDQQDRGHRRGTENPMSELNRDRVLEEIDQGR